MAVTMESVVFMSWERITRLLTLKQMFDISTRLVSEQSDEITGLETICFENHSWKYLSLLVTNESSISGARRSTSFSDSVLSPGKILEKS